jgi:predicted TIM-barrel fold metal-dependent hydrolase
VFGPAAHFPFALERTYTPADAPKEALALLHKHLGIDRAVFVQPAVYGFDHSAMLDAIAADPDHRRGVALIADDAADSTLEFLNGKGIRGVRFNFLPHLSAPPSPAIFARTAHRVAERGWHIVVHVRPGDLALIDDYANGLPVPLVIDHLARIPAASGIDGPDVKALLKLARRSNVWVKLSGADRGSALGAPFSDMLALLHALIHCAPERMLWGTDWPHPNISGAVPDEADLLALLQRAVPGQEVLAQILVSNPARLYGFSA